MTTNEIHDLIQNCHQTNDEAALGRILVVLEHLNNKLAELERLTAGIRVEAEKRSLVRQAYHDRRRAAYARAAEIEQDPKRKAYLRKMAGLDPVDSASEG